MATVAPERRIVADAAPSHDAPTMRALLDAQRADFIAHLPVPLAVRRDRLDRAIAMMVDHADRWCAACTEDFGNRSRELTLMTDVLPSVGALKHAKKHLNAWMSGEKRKPIFPLGLLGASARVDYQPKGVVGIIAPWNFPIGMVMTPLAGVFAAGNRAIAKPSEFTPNVTALFAELVPQYFSPEELAIVTGGPDVGQAFSQLPFDHMIFTGATSVGRHIMRAAADNLVPVTLELGGKSPVIVGQSADLNDVAAKVTMGKLMNAGQICLAPDYILVDQAREGALVEALIASASAMYPTILDNNDYTAVVNDRHHARLSAHVADARAKGADITIVNPAGEDFASANSRKMPLHIISGATDEMSVMQDEIFGPLLPIRRVANSDAAIDYVNGRDRPLGLYYFGKDAGEERKVLDRTISGGVTVNDVIFHVAQEDLPFGGVGPSGMGSYHGFDGFKTFSHAKSIFRQARFDVAKLAGLKPPYGKTTQSAIARDLKK
ncbi:MAG: coniferyl aldehyde dehydrogenase [Pseudomonadota bacterium]